MNNKKKIINKIMITGFLLWGILAGCSSGSGDILDSVMGLDTSDNSTDDTTTSTPTGGGNDDGTNDGTGGGTAQPDLQLVSFTLPATTMLHDNTYDISITVTNNSTVAVNSSFYVSARLSSNINYVGSSSCYTTTYSDSIGATQIASLAAGANTTINVPITVSAGQTLGINYIGVCLDSGGSIAESSETNNYGTDVGSFIQQVSIAEYRPDFTLTSFDPPATMTRSTLYYINVTLTNSGNKDNNIAFYVSARLSSNINYVGSSSCYTTTYSDTIGATQIASLASGASTTITVPLTVSSGQTLGINYIGVCLDSGSQVTEYSNGGETNNYGATVGTHIKQITVN